MEWQKTQIIIPDDDYDEDDEIDERLRKQKKSKVNRGNNIHGT